eukprot:Gregarina_sp_Poly_1__834@NODE_119_length_13600_cov_173_393926_g106_i0_p2_GENE_NODE_119_length_13600_cov_173_393926_g106_i0NODE_119_length_13600_cov_173_393926_g106_i0_p2_ORF_typecomplete_len634_score127_47Tropomyosin_1/PF12718_7/4e02Tropomyosin_1/PF12718_7/0_015Tropomyosin_1/PF12718_7/1_3e03Tropomyosin_1/PF12718_7/1_8e04Tropomyosin_1/PF12718_7/15Tropomyosin_1/PF12718_7/1_5e02Tropomyosin_1/PF12718_7/1_8e04AAA_13/PF13166_6/0_55AAA_13/PF13166_6/1_8e04FANCF/PF11107_8/4_2e02FANCF/PF11107_8/4e03FANCF/
MLERKEELNMEEEQLSIALTSLEECRGIYELIAEKEKKIQEYEKKIESLKDVDPVVQSGTAYQELSRSCGPFDVSSWQTKVSNALNKTSKNLANVRDASQQRSRDFGRAENEVVTLESRIQASENEVHRLKTQLKKDLGVSDESEYTIRRRQLREELDEVMKEMLTIKNAQELYTNYYEYSVKRRKCAFCTRPFCDSKEIEAFTTHLKSRISKMPEQQEQAEQELEQKQTALEKLEQETDKISRLAQLIKNEIPQLQNAKTAAASVLKEAKRALEETKIEETSVAQKHKDLQLISQTLTELDELETEVALITEDLKDAKERATSMLPSEAPSAIRSNKRTRHQLVSGNLNQLNFNSIPELREKEKTVRQERQKLNDKIMKMTQSRNEMELLECELKQWKNTIANLQNKVQEISMEPQGSEFESLRKIEQLESQLRDMETQATQVEAMEESTAAAKEQAMRNYMTASEESAKRFITLNTAITDTENLSARLQTEYIHLSELGSLTNLTKEAEREFQIAKDTAKHSRGRLSDVEQRIRERIDIEIQLDRNLQLKEIQKELSELRKQQLNMEKLQGSTNVRELRKNLEKDLEELRQCDMEIMSHLGSFRDFIEGFTFSSLCHCFQYVIAALRKQEN